MPANTANRAYPYSVPADAVDIPGDIQRLAEAIDSDVAGLTQSVPQRPAVRISGTGPFIATTNSAVVGDGTSLPMTTEDFNTGLTYTLQDLSFFGGPTTRSIRILEAGIYLVVGSVGVPRPTSGTNRVDMGLHIREGSGSVSAAIVRARHSNSLQPSASDGIRTMTVSGLVRMTGGVGQGYLSLWFHSRTAAGGVDNYTVAARSLTIIRMDPTP